MKIAFPFSISILFWSFVGAIRFIFENKIERKRNLPSKIFKEERKKIAVCLPAHNEEDVIEKSLNSIKKFIPTKQIYVISDGSTDNTAKIARRLRTNLMVNKKGKGKSRALRDAIKKFGLLDKFEYILIVDADTTLDNLYLRRALRYMHFHPETAALSAHANPYWRKKSAFTLPDFISAYRTRLYKILQICFMYGQTWKYTNVNVVIPGFAALYRTRALRKLKLYTRGVWIEDFSLAFQVHKKGLGNIAYHPNISATYQDPRNLKDYWKQVQRWNVGFYQTIKAQGFWPSFFWISLIVFTFELFSFSIFILTIPILATLLLLHFTEFPQIEQNFISIFFFPYGFIYAFEVLGSLLLVDYLITVFIAIKEKKYRLLVYGPFFILFQIINSLILIVSLKRGLFGGSAPGTWTHAKRN
jgi:biofilm PGA synthesis N-glycosyltransferase PgaC